MEREERPREPAPGPVGCQVEAPSISLGASWTEAASLGVDQIWIESAEIFDRALTALLEDFARTECAATQRPRASRGTARGSRHIPAMVKRAVWLRDGSRCAFVARSGRRCAERGFLELHHVEPHAVGGEATVDNIQLRCRAHNAYEAELFYGPAKLVRGDGVVREPSSLDSPSISSLRATRRSPRLRRTQPARSPSSWRTLVTRSPLGS